MIVEEKKIAAFEKRKQRDFDRKFAKKVNSLSKTSAKDKHTNKEGHEGAAAAVNKPVAKTGDAKKDFRNSEKQFDTPRKSFKRKAMDKKYGFGGKDRKRAKLNDSKSLNDFKSFNPKGGKQIRGAAAKMNKKRPGKDARNKSKKPAGGRGKK